MFANFKPKYILKISGKSKYMFPRPNLYLQKRKNKDTQKFIMSRMESDVILKDPMLPKMYTNSS